MNFGEESAPVLFCYAMHKDPGGTLAVELVANDCVAPTAADKALGFGAVVGELVMQQIVEVRGRPLRADCEDGGVGLLVDRVGRPVMDCWLMELLDEYPGQVGARREPILASSSASALLL